MQAEEAADCERATADELLALLKEKESEISQLRRVGGPAAVAALRVVICDLHALGFLSHGVAVGCSCRYRARENLGPFTPRRT